ncbi:MAG: deoxyribose-phosphate aldolase [Patescibacteria group bacterium]
MMDLAKYLDNANHNASSTEADIRKVCQEVKEYGFNSAFVNPCWVAFARGVLGNDGKVGTVVSYPLGQDTTESKINACLDCQKDGADELDVSANVGWLKESRDDNYLGELIKITRAVKNQNPKTVVKFIIEACLLTEQEIKRASEYVLQSGADFVKTTSGFGNRDAKVEYVKTIESVIQNKIRIKAAGGIKTAKQVREYIEAGADRIGTSRAVEIITSS